MSPGSSVAVPEITGVAELAVRLLTVGTIGAAVSMVNSPVVLSVDELLAASDTKGV